jgi:hypothetical protein
MWIKERVGWEGNLTKLLSDCPRFVRSWLVHPIAFFGLSIGGSQALDMLTWQNGLARQGQNTNETILTPENVNSSQFGKLFSRRVDGYVFAQPLYLSDLSIPGKGLYNVVYIATQHDGVFAFDADGNDGSEPEPLWKRTFIDPSKGITTIPIGDIGLADPPELGIISTPVIDRDSGTLFVMAKTKEITNGLVRHFYRFHALDVRTGAEKFGGPVLVEASVPGVGDATDGGGNVVFDARYQANRAGLALVNGVVYAGFGTQGDIAPVHGWLLGYDAATLRQRAAFCTTPNADRGGIWMAGAAPAADEQGNLYVMTGNGVFTPPLANYGNSLLKLRPSGNTLLVDDYFTPANQDWRARNDADLGSSGCLLLPNTAGTPAHPHLVVGTGGKGGLMYLFDRDDLGGYSAIKDTAFQSITGPTNGSWSTPAYFDGTVYTVGFRETIKAYSITNSQLSTEAIHRGTVLFGYPGATPCISANGVKDGIVWAVQADGYSSQTPAILHAFNAKDVSQTLYTSADAGWRDTPGPAMKFSTPTVINGKVYIASGFGVDVFGLIGRPQLVNEPQGQSVVEGKPLTLSVTAVGTPPFRYRWELDGTEIKGQTSAWLQIPAAKVSDSGSYSVTVENAEGSSTSEPAAVIVHPPLAIQFYAGLTVTGNIGETYEIQFRPDIADAPWVTIATLNLTSTSQIWFDVDSVHRARGFYQTLLLE